jgi:hypothetical protein
MSKLITSCASCDSSNVFVSCVRCENCETRFEGQFEIPGLLKLHPDDLQFITLFVQHSGSLKEMAKEMNISYPTVRNRLNEIIDALKEVQNTQLRENEKILKALETGRISAKDAAKKLSKL